MDGYLGEIRMFSFGYAPRGWVECNGAILAISSNQALFSLLGTTYGGNGVQTFAVPDLRGCVVLGQGNSTGGNFAWGQKSGTEKVSLITSQLPPHIHNLVASTLAPNSIPAAGCMLATTTALQYA
ncbi:MAG: tail fiber protein, partial [Pedobacter sp.]|nr:tail fiber protein [Pedobacter sp.]